MGCNPWNEKNEVAEKDFGTSCAKKLLRDTLPNIRNISS